jgi:hypothetical protein
MFIFAPMTIVTVLAAWVIFKLAMQLVFYPQFFTRLKHIPSPKVWHQPQFSQSKLTENSIGAG